MRQALRLYFAGPAGTLGGLVSAAMTVWAVVAGLRGDAIWMWLFFGAVALVALSFRHVYQNEQAQERERRKRAASVPAGLDNFIREAIHLEAELGVPPSTPRSIFPLDDRLDKAVDFVRRVCKFLIVRHPAYVDDVLKRITESTAAEGQQRDREHGDEVPSENLHERTARSPAVVVMSAALEALREIRKTFD